jgi:TnpA family transposase
LRQESYEGLNIIENWNSANSFIFYGKSREIVRKCVNLGERAIHWNSACATVMRKNSK